jgi:hypothetical protein
MSKPKAKRTSFVRLRTGSYSSVTKLFSSIISPSKSTTASPWRNSTSHSTELKGKGTSFEEITCYLLLNIEFGELEVFEELMILSFLFDSTIFEAIFHFLPP